MSFSLFLFLHPLILFTAGEAVGQDPQKVMKVSQTLELVGYMRDLGRGRGRGRGGMKDEMKEERRGE